MGLDIYLIRNKNVSYDDCKTWQNEREICFDANITHNLGNMADKAGIYQCIWRPEELGFFKASQIIDLLEKGIDDMRHRPFFFKQFDASNGWGTYDDFLPWLERYLKACKEYPDAIIEGSR